MSLPALDPDELAAMDHVAAAYRTITGWGLRSNQGELAAAVHVLQGFVIQHYLARCAPDVWGDWYGPPPAGGPAPLGGFDPSRPSPREGFGIESEATGRPLT